MCHELRAKLHLLPAGVVRHATRDRRHWVRPPRTMHAAAWPSRMSSASLLHVLVLWLVVELRELKWDGRLIRVERRQRFGDRANKGSTGRTCKSVNPWALGKPADGHIAEDDGVCLALRRREEAVSSQCRRAASHGQAGRQLREARSGSASRTRRHVLPTRPSTPRALTSTMSQVYDPGPAVTQVR
jgi:hypothetical protein